MSAPFHPSTPRQDYYYGIPVLQSGSEQGQQFFGSVLQALGSQRQMREEQQMAEMAAARLEGLGEQGSYWAQQIRKDPRAALMLADQYGGFGEIEGRLIAARSAGASTAAMERAIEAAGGPQALGINPAELEILRQGGPKALKEYREAIQGEQADGPASYTTDEGVYVRDPSAPDGYRRVGSPKKSGGLAMEFDDQGRVVGFSMGGGQITNTTRAKVEEKSFNAQGMLSRLDQIRSSFKPEFQTWGGKTRIAILQARASAGGDLSEDEATQLRDVASFKVSAFNNMNRILNELSGAAISPAEAERLKQELPNPGTGLFDGDDPVSFRAKMDAVESQVRTAIELYDRQLNREAPQTIPDRGDGASRPTPIPAAAEPLPPREQLVKGKVYETKKGPARWNGASFSLVE